MRTTDTTLDRSLPSPGPRGPGHPRRWWVLVALCLSLLVVGLDGTVLNVALDHIAGALGSTTTQLQWVVNGYALTSAVLLVPAGVLGDRLGRVRVLASGLTLFLGASLLAAFAGSTGLLIAARTVMGIGAAAVFPISLSIIPTVFSAHERPKAVAVVTATMGLGMPLGPIVGGWLLDHYWWGSTMLINVPVIGLALTAGLLVIPETRDRSSRPADLPGVTLVVLALGTLVFGIIEAPARGWTDLRVLSSLVCAAVAFALLVIVERRSPSPLLDRAILARPLFLWPTLATALASFVMLGLLFTVPLYLQGVVGDGAMTTGLKLMPIMVALVVGAALSGPLTRLLAPKGSIVIGMLVSGLGFLPLLQVSPASGYGPLALGFVVVGLGFGLAMAPAMDAVLGSLDAGKESTGTALNLAVKQTGGVLGVAVLGSVLTAHLNADAVDSAAVRAVAFIDGMHAIDSVALGAAVVTAALVAVGLRGRAGGSTAPVPDEANV